MGKGGSVSIRTTAKLIGCVLATVLICGCATGPGGVTDEEQIMARLETLKAGVLGKDIEKVRGVVSEDFYYPGMGDKENALDLVQEGMDTGIVDDGEIDLEDTEIKIEGDIATAGPIEVGNPMGSATVEFEFKKEGGGWLIIGGTADGF